jgi:2-polyprenyl-6-methoxyphenol hydroxylase-like FAD-dependent oxidoreductase
MSPNTCRLSLRSAHTPVLIVGAGPTGLTLAIELARRGIAFRLIDREAEPPATSRAIGTQPRTVEVFRLMGIPVAALEPAVRPRALRFAERDRTLARIDFAARPAGSAPGLLVMDESDTERVLARRLEQLGERVERGVALRGFRVEENRVVATLDGPVGESIVTGTFLVGADGAHSLVRREAGIAFSGSAYPERFILADLDLDWALPHDEGHVWIGDDGLVAAVPLPGPRRYRLIVPLPPGEAVADDTSEEDLAGRAETLLRQRTGVALRRIGEPIWASAFRIARRQAARYRQGPIFLAGDAAHVHSPVGGQGMNTGIQDAFNLGWKLALAVRGEAAPGLLDTYQEERYPVGQAVLRGTDLGTRLVLARNPVARAFRERVIPVAAGLAPVRDRLLAAISQLAVNYRDSPVSVDADANTRDEARGWFRRPPAGLQAGDRVSDIPLLDAGTGGAISLFDLIAQGWILLLFPGDDGGLDAIAMLESLAREAREMVGGAVHPYLVSSVPTSHETVTAALVDPIGEASRAFGARDGLVALVRPDGYLGYRGRPDQPLELASYLARIFALRLPGLGHDYSTASRGAGV